MTSSLPLNRLHISPLNVRKTDRALDIDQLADAIAAKGLLQNLVVVPEGASGRFGVVAGGRRLLALQLLVERGVLAAEWPVPVLREKLADGREISLDENLQRVDMNPVDEFEAYAAIIDDYAGRGQADLAARVDRCARHFGVTVRHVEQRLRLAALAPDILDALRDRRITLDAAKAYAAYPDQDLQMRVFASQEGIGAHIHGNRHNVPAIRARMAERVYRATDRRVVYAGVDAYLAAGGRVVRELFMGRDDDDVLLDTTLVDRLLADKAAIDLPGVAAAAGFAEARLLSWPLETDFPKTPKTYLARWGAVVSMAADDRADAILVCALAEDGSAIVPTNNAFVPDRPRAAAGPADVDVGAGAIEGAGDLVDAARPRLSQPAPASRHESEIDRLGRVRREEIESRALRLAARALLREIPEGRAVYPTPHRGTVPIVRRAEDGTSYQIAIYVTVTADEFARVAAAAERQYDVDESARAAAAAGLATDLDAAGPPLAAAADRVDREPEWPLRADLPADDAVRAMEPAL